MNTKNTKKRFILSLVVTIVSIAMLVGTTFAWFTDSVTSGKNKIVAGNLDVELLHFTTDAASATTVQDATNLFNVSLWEPGVVAYENFIVSNDGNLALKYALNLSIANKNAVSETNKDLSEVIKVAVVKDGFTGDRVAAQALSGYQTLKDFQETGNLKAKGTTGQDSATYGVVLYWEPTDYDNDYNLNNGKTSTDGQPLFIEFGVNLVATQDTVEADSFDKNYDLSAQLPVVVSFPSIKKTDLETDKTVKIEEKGAIKSAEVPVKGTATVFEGLQQDEATYDNNLTLTLNVSETSNKEEEIKGGTKTTIDLDINMSAVMTSTNVSTKEVVTNKQEKVESLTEFTTIEMYIGEDFENVSVLHKGIAMQPLASADKVPTDTTNGGFFYDETNGIITLKTMTFSPFTIIGKKGIKFPTVEKKIPEGCTYQVDGGKKYTEGEELPSDYEPKSGDTFEDGEYIYKYNRAKPLSDFQAWEAMDSANGWGVVAKNKNQSSYGLMMSSINGKPVKIFKSTYYNCKKLETAPAIPNCATNLDYAFVGCSALKTAPYISNNVSNVFGTFDGCTELKGMVEIDGNIDIGDGNNYNYFLNNCAQNQEHAIVISGLADVTVLEKLKSTGGEFISIQK